MTVTLSKEMSCHSTFLLQYLSPTYIPFSNKYLRTRTHIINIYKTNYQREVYYCQN